MLPMKKAKVFFTNFTKVINCNYNVSFRYYSRYPQTFVDPVTNKDEVDEIIKTKSSMEINLTLVKAANHFATCSVFFDPDVHFLSQRLMRDGNRKLAQSLVHDTFQTIKKIQLMKYYAAPEDSRDEIDYNPKEIFHKALVNTTPILGTKLIKRSGTWYNIPCMVTPKRAKFLALKFIIESASEKDRKERYYVSLAEEIIRASQNKGKAVQKKIDLHKYCEANRAYAHYRWT